MALCQQSSHRWGKFFTVGACGWHVTVSPHPSMLPQFLSSPMMTPYSSGDTGVGTQPVVFASHQR